MEPGRQVRPLDGGGVAGGSAARGACAPGEHARRDRGHGGPVLRCRHRRGRQAAGRGRARDRRMAWTATVLAGSPRRVPDQHLGNPRTPGHRAPPRRRHLRGDGGGTVRTRLHPAEAGIQAAHRRKALPRAGAGPSRSVQRNHRCADRQAPRPRLEVRGDRAGGATASRTTTRWRRTRPPACSTSSWKPAAPTRSGCTSPRCIIRAAAT